MSKTKGIPLKIQPNKTQQRAMASLRAEWRRANSMMVYAPVGSGKTGLAAFIIAGFRAAGLRVMFAAPYTILIKQTVQRLVEYGIDDFDIGVVWADHPASPDAPIQIASAQTLQRRGIPDNIDLLIVDEAHLYCEMIYNWIYENCVKKPVDVKGKKAIGLSGTPFSKWLGNVYQVLTKPVTMKELIEEGALSRYELYAPIKPDMTGIKPKTDNDGQQYYSEADNFKVMGTSEITGNIVQNWLEHGENRATICFCVNVAHANYVVMEFQRSGVKAEIMTATTPKDERDRMICRYEDGITRILVNVGVLVAGFDSRVRCIIFASLCGSEMRWIQSIGRGLRTEPDKDYCLIFDHTGTAVKLGFPDEIEYDELERKDHKSAKNAAAKKERTEKQPKECPSCKFLKPAAVYECPKCGFKPMMGEDVPTNASGKLGKATKAVAAPATREDKEKFWREIKGYQAASVMTKPKSDGWCSHTYREKFGEWPPKYFSSEPLPPGPVVSNFIRSKLIRFSKAKK